MEETVKLTRDLNAVQVPFGTPAVLDKDTEVTITYALGGSYTVVTEGCMYHVDSKDADALGKEPIDLKPILAYDENTSLENKIWGTLRSCFDPEIPVNIVDLGLVYKIDIAEVNKDKNEFNVKIRMTLTAAGCGMGQVITDNAKARVANLEEIKDVEIDIVFDPPWDREMMSEQAKLELGLL